MQMVWVGGFFCLFWGFCCCWFWGDFFVWLLLLLFDLFLFLNLV